MFARGVRTFCYPRGGRVPENQRLLLPQSQFSIIALRRAGYDCENIRMSTFNAKCPNCSSLCDVPSTYINQEVKCPSCAKTYVAEPCLDLPAPPIKAEEPKAPSTPQDASLPKGQYTAVWSKYTTGISKGEPLLHRILRYATLGALIVAIMNVWRSIELGTLSATGVIWNNLIAVILFWGSAQLVQFLHSIAWNTQEARRERIES
jgi:hypothetical protein